MPRPRQRIKREDINQKAIANTFKLAGLSALNLSNVGGGCPDLLIAAKVGEKSITVLIEIKNPSSRSYQKKLTAEQQEFYNDWKGKIFIVRTTKEAEELSQKLLDLLKG